ncbi:MAG: CYTH domain-containing protein [Pseudomonadota bacterium]
MPIEIERKFLVQGTSWRGMVKNGQKLRQGYLHSDGRCSVRVRLDNKQCSLTVKLGGSSLRRHEFKLPISQEEAENLIEANVISNVIEKTRFVVNHNGNRWEIDEFHGPLDGLLLAEIELEDERTEFDVPEWIGHEVTDDPKFLNQNLAKLTAPPTASR